MNYVSLALLWRKKTNKIGRQYAPPPPPFLIRPILSSAAEISASWQHQPGCCGSLCRRRGVLSRRRGTPPRTRGTSCRRAEPRSSASAAAPPQCCIRTAAAGTGPAQCSPLCDISELAFYKQLILCTFMSLESE
jgi:hypothetical protein